MTSSELVRLFVQGFVPALAVITAGIPFYIHYRSRVNTLLSDLNVEVKKIIRMQFLEPLNDRKPGIRDVEDADLPLKYIRAWGKITCQRQYWKLAVAKAGLSAVGTALCWFGRYLLAYLFDPSASVSLTVHGSSITLKLATVQSSLIKASIVLALLFAFFAFLVVIRFELGDEETTLPHPRE